MFINETGVVATIIQSGVVSVIGNEFLAYLFMVFLLVVLCLLFRVPLEFSMAFVLPLMLYLWAYDASFTAVGGTTLIYLAIVFARMLAR